MTTVRRRPLHVLIMAKAPVAGRVKTRLCPPLSWAEAAEVAEAALVDTFVAVLACRADRIVVALDGSVGSWLPDGVEVIAQRGDGLASRLANAWADTNAGASGWGIQIGMDTPQVTAESLDAVLASLTEVPATSTHRSHAVLGPAVDGGWWVIGLPGIDPHDVFTGIPMSSANTFAEQERRLRSLGLDVVAAPAMRDIDTADDLRAVAEMAPGSRTAQVARRVLQPVGALRVDGAF